MHGGLSREDASVSDALRSLVDSALAVTVQTEWLASRPMIPLIVTADINVPAHIQAVAANVRRLADYLDHTIESDTTLRRHESGVVDAVFIIAVMGRLFVIRWTDTAVADPGLFNTEVQRLRQDIDRILGSLSA